MKLISDYRIDGVRTLREGTGQNQRLYIAGIFMQAEAENKNHRVYSRDVLAPAVDAYLKDYVMTNRAVGELNHPEGASINLDRVSHRITELKWDGDNVIGKALILRETPCGAIAAGLINGGCQLGVSSRGLGTVQNMGGISHVDDGFILAAVDIVQDPSAPSAFVNGIMESIDWNVVGGKFVANKVDRFAENLKKLSKTVSARVYTEAQEVAFKKFLKSL